VLQQRAAVQKTAETRIIHFVMLMLFILHF